MSQLIKSPFPVYIDSKGDPLEDGFIYIGIAGVEPSTNPIDTFWDKDLQEPAAQPIRTLAGIPSKNGSAAALYVAESDYSIKLLDKNGNLIVSSLSTTEVAANDTIYTNISAMRASVDPAESVVTVQGYYVAGDGGGGPFYWNSASVDADNGGTIIKVTAILTGRWIRLDSEQIDVRWFGAKGDGTTDDSTAIQAAFDAHKIVDFISPEYVFGISTGLTVPTGRILNFNGATLKRLVNLITPMLGASAVSDIIIDTPRIDGNYTVQTATNATIDFNAVTNGLISNMTAIDMGSTVATSANGAVNIEDCVSVIVDNANIDNTWGMDGVRVQGSLGKDVTVKYSSITNTISDSGLATRDAPYCKVIGNYIEASPGSLISFNSPSGSVTDNVCIASATLIGTANGITLGHPALPTDMTVCNGNKIIMGGFGYSGIVCANGDDVTINNNSIEGAAANTYGILTSELNTIIIDNTITGFPSGILGNATSKVTIRGNDVYGLNTGTTYGIATAAIVSTISGNTIDNFTRCVNIIASATQCIVTGNNMEGFSGFGIVANGSGYSIGHNQLNASGTGQPLLLNGSGGSVTGNILNTTGIPVSAGYGAIDGGSTFRSNIINGAGVEVDVTLGAAAVSSVINNENIVTGMAVSIVSNDANFNARNVYVSAVSLGTLTLTYIAGTASSCKLIIL